MTIEQAFQQATHLLHSGRMAEAEAIYRQILEVEPRHADSLHMLGAIAGQTGRSDIAVELIRQSTILKPGFALAHSNLGNALKDQGKLDEAIAAYRQAIVIDPGFAMAHNNLGRALKDKGHLREAIAAYRQAIALHPSYPEAHSNLGAALWEDGQLDEAIAACRQAIALKPDFPEAYCNLGVALKDDGQLDEAVAACRQAIALAPNFPQAHCSLGNALKDKGRLIESITAYRQAIVLKPSFPQAHSNLSYALLGRGDFLDGWQEFEWRMKCSIPDAPRQKLTQAQWDGCPLEGHTILLHTEQGFGDALQFIRYAPLASRRGGKIVIECEPELQRLFLTIDGASKVVARGGSLPSFDVQCPLLSLPRIFGTTLATIPNSVPYLHAAATEAGKWRERLADDSPSFKAGLVWAGEKNRAPQFRNRAANLATLAPLARVPGVRFISLQKGQASAEAGNPPKGMELTDMTGELKDFSDTAALVASLDLVISVDTSVAHLAGAMGKPVWVLLPFVADWRWFRDRSDSPWYPTMRLFRQPAIGQWEPVIAEVREKLELLVKSRK